MGAYSYLDEGLVGQGPRFSERIVWSQIQSDSLTHYVK